MVSGGGGCLQEWVNEEGNGRVCLILHSLVQHNCMYGQSVHSLWAWVCLGSGAQLIVQSINSIIAQSINSTVPCSATDDIHLHLPYQRRQCCRRGLHHLHDQTLDSRLCIAIAIAYSGCAECVSIAIAYSV
jgi:hypothetical protein